MRSKVVLLGVGWGVVGLVVALSQVPNATADARPAVAAASIVFPAAAFGAATAAHFDRVRLAGALLTVSAATPTYFAWVLNVPALVVGVVLLVRVPRRRAVA